MANEKPVAELGVRVIVAVLTLLGGSLAMFSAQLSVSGVSTFLPFLETGDLALPSDSVVTLSVIGLATTILGAPLFGFLADRVGKRWLSLIGAAVLGISVAATGLMASLPTLALAYVGVALGTSMLLAPLVAQMLVDTGTHWFLASVAAIYLAMTQLADVASTAGVVIADQVGVRSVLIGLGSATFVIAGIGLGLVGVSHLVSRRFAWRDEWLDATGDRVQSASLVLVLAAVFLIGWATTTIEAFASFYATEELGIQVSDLGLVFAALGAAAVIIALCTPFAGMTADLFDWLTLRTVHRRLGRQLLVAIGVLILCSGLGILLLATNTEGVAGSMIAGRLGSAVLGPSILALVIARAPHRSWGAMAGLYLAADAAGKVGIIPSSFAADKLGLPSSFGLAIIVAVLALPLIAWASWLEPVRQQEPDPAVTPPAY